MEKKSKIIRCPDCQNYMIVTAYANGEAKGYCKKCKSTIIARQQSEKVRLIRIVKS